MWSSLENQSAECTSCCIHPKGPEKGGCIEMGQRTTQIRSCGLTCDGWQKKRQKSSCVKGQPKGCCVPRWTAFDPDGQNATNGIGHPCNSEAQTRRGPKASVFFATSGWVRCVFEHHRQFADALATRVALLEPPPNEVPIRAQAKGCSGKRTRRRDKLRT